MSRLGRLVCLALSSSVPAFCATISLEPSASSAPLGSPVEINVNVSGVSDLFGWQFDIAFNPAILSAASVTEGSLFSSAGVFFSQGIVDNTAGLISFIADALSGSGPGISTDGTLAVILFNSIGAGSSSINLSNVLLLDSGLNDIIAAESGGSVLVAEPSAVPEPGTFVLALPVLGAIGFRLRRIA